MYLCNTRKRILVPDNDVVPTIVLSVGFYTKADNNAVSIIIDIPVEGQKPITRFILIVRSSTSKLSVLV